MCIGVIEQRGSSSPLNKTNVWAKYKPKMEERYANLLSPRIPKSRRPFTKYLLLHN